MVKQELSFSPLTIWRLTWPQIVFMFFFFCLGLCDVWTAGKLGKDVQAAFGLVAQCVMFLQVFAMAMAGGATAAISQSLGSCLVRRACRYVGMVVIFSLILGLFVALLAYVGHTQLFALLQTPQDILPITLSYWKITLITLPFGYIFSATTALFRATRQVRPPLFVALFMVLGNFGGNLGFGLGYFGFPAFGYVGIAWTTFICTALGAVCNVILLVHSGYLNKKDMPHLRWMRAALPYLGKVAVPAGASQLVWQSGYIMLFTVAASMPYDSINTLAGLTAGMRLEALLFLPGLAFSMTASVLVGNSLGAGNIAEAHRLARLLTVTGVLCMSAVAAVLWFFIPELASFLATDAVTQATIVSYLRFNFLATPFTLTSMILGGVMTGAGATKYNLIIYGGSFWCVRLPLAWIFGHYIWQSASGIFLGMLISQVVQSSIMCMVVLRGHWTRFAMKPKHASKKCHEKV